MKNYYSKKQWINWKFEKVEGKITKVPYQVNGSKASSTNPQHWSTYKEAKAQSQSIGIVFTDSQTLLGVDIDHCLKNGRIEHDEKEKIADFILAAETYTEISPSQTGLHFYFELTEAFTPIVNKHAPYELYTKGRFFTVTEQSYGEEKEIRTVTLEQLNELLAILGYPWGKDKAATSVAALSSSTETMDDETVLRKMFKSKNGTKVKSLYDGDTSEQKGDESAADAALCMHLAYWTGKNAAQMERIWVSSPLGKREKTQKRQDYRTRTIAGAIQSCTKVYESTASKTQKDNPELDLLFTFMRGEKVFTQNLENMCRILRKHPAFVGRLYLDEFKNNIYIKVGDAFRPFRDSDILDIQTEISILFIPFRKVGKDMIFDAIVKVATENRIDSAKEYLKSLKWDKKYRLDEWLHHTYGVENNEYHKSVGSNWMKGLVHRLVEPGCKFDYVLTLEGEQGIKKSTSLYVLGGDWYAETAMSTDSKDFFMQFSGKAIIEFSEGETLSRTEVKRMKAIITMQSDNYRPPYGRLVAEFPRRCVFAMTTNQSEYLKDETGNRRWLPVKCLKEADIEWLKANRDQLFAEAYHRLVVKKETTYEFPTTLLVAEQNLRRIENPWEEAVRDWYFSLTETERENGITTTMAYQKGVQKSQAFSKEIGSYESLMVAGILKNILRLEKKRTTEGGERTYRHYPTEATRKMAPKTLMIDLTEKAFNDF